MVKGISFNLCLNPCLSVMRSIGAHVSSSGGLDQAIKRAVDIGCNSCQVFSGSPRSWVRKNLSDINLDKYFAKIKEYSFGAVFTHSLYLINLTAKKPELIQKSMQALIYDLRFDSAIKGSGVVVHLGSHLGLGFAAVRENLVKRLREILAVTPADSTLLIENSAGQKGKLCSDLSEIRWILDQLDSERVGVCIDTCHSFASGYSLANSKSQIINPKQKAANLDPRCLTVANQLSHAEDDGRGGAISLVEEIERLKLWNDIKCIHVNDSRDEFGSGRDRHANLGEGNIPQEDMRYFLNYPQVRSLPLILEVPELKGGEGRENVRRLKELIIRV